MMQVIRVLGLTLGLLLGGAAGAQQPARWAPDQDRGGAASACYALHRDHQAAAGGAEIKGGNRCSFDTII